ncbi:hypothetical protein [Mycoplasma procyoni]|uniref:hypothetical protein n=1 Tax=Mycoplasma procyoni TaxID=568784 RepID=UPI00197C394B|nr:hypothetical protein [Mycoplasma procyoni]MBN3534548.1 hypothetical protein [Mycoplasma procyoni]
MFKKWKLLLPLSVLAFSPAFVFSCSKVSEQKDTAKPNPQDPGKPDPNKPNPQEPGKSDPNTPKPEDPGKSDPNNPNPGETGSKDPEPEKPKDPVDKTEEQKAELINTKLLELLKTAQLKDAESSFIIGQNTYSFVNLYDLTKDTQFRIIEDDHLWTPIFDQVAVGGTVQNVYSEKNEFEFIKPQPFKDAVRFFFKPNKNPFYKNKKYKIVIFDTNEDQTEITRYEFFDLSKYPLLIDLSPIQVKQTKDKVILKTISKSFEALPSEIHSISYTFEEDKKENTEDSMPKKTITKEIPFSYGDYDEESDSGLLETEIEFSKGDFDPDKKYNLVNVSFKYTRDGQEFTENQREINIAQPLSYNYSPSYSLVSEDAQNKTKTYKLNEGDSKIKSIEIAVKLSFLNSKEENGKTVSSKEVKYINVKVENNQFVVNTTGLEKYTIEEFIINYEKNVTFILEAKND